MALGKTSKKTKQTSSEAPSKSKAPVAKATARTAQTIAEKTVKGSATAGTTAGPKKAPAVVTVQSSSLPESLPVHQNPEPLKAMAAAASVGSREQTPAVSQVAATNGDHHGNEIHHGSNGATAVNGERQAVRREEIAHLAYRYWAERGYSHGSAEEDWKRAEAELIKQS